MAAAQKAVDKVELMKEIAAMMGEGGFWGGFSSFDKIIFYNLFFFNNFLINDFSSFDKIIFYNLFFFFF